MKRYFYSFFILTFFLPIILYPQDIGTITGKLIDQDGNGLGGLKLQLYISSKVYSTYSFPDGSFTFDNISNVIDGELPTGYFVSDNFPNPFNPKTRINVTQPNSGKVKVDVYNLLGQKVGDDIEQYFNAGTNFIDVELNGLPNGFYAAQITLGEKYSVTKKLMLIYGSQHLLPSIGISNIRLNKSILDVRIDSLVVTGSSISRKVFTNLPIMVGNSLNLGNLVINPPPQPPTLIGPLNGATNLPPSTLLSWIMSSGATSYTLQVSKDNLFSSYFINQSGIINTSQQISGLDYSTTYFWRVNAANIFGTSDWSPVRSFATQPPPPQPPLLSSPANGAINLSCSTLLLWNVSIGATSYTLQVSTSNTFSSFVFYLPTIFSTSQQLALDYYTTYYWRVSASNNNGTSDWSSVWSFTTQEPPYPPVPPVLSSPANGETNISLSPTLSWNASSGATSYTLKVSMQVILTNPAFNNNMIVYDQNVGNNTSQQLTGLYHSTKYIWRVFALNSYGISAPAERSFTTEGGPPCPGTPTVDYAGKVYNTVQIGNQCWLAENLDVGTAIAVTQTPSNNGIIEKYCVDPNNCAAAGGLYLWNEAMQYVTSPGNKGICPAGWHIPTLAEFQTLNAAVNGDGSSLKSTSQLNSNFGVTGGTNTSGFSALLAGDRWNGGAIQWFGETANFWSSTEHGNPDFAYTLGLSINNSTITIVENTKDIGFSVRCLKN